MRKFVVGDIHGAAKALKQCLDLVSFDYKNDWLIQLGDVADGWSETSECVDILLSINNLISIRGNHDVWCYDWMEKGISPILWTQQGGQATLDSYIRTQRFIDRDHKEFWKNQKDWFIDHENRLFIHAGWDYMAKNELKHSGMTDLELFEIQASLPVNAGSVAKECCWNRSIFQGAASAFWNGNKSGRFKPLETFNEIYIGHTAHKAGKPLWLGNLCNMDTGCGWHGHLTIMDIDSKEYWVSDKSSDLYPDEKGRR